MWRYLFASFLFISNLSEAQETQKVVLKETRETYYVLKSDKSVRHGSYERRNMLQDMVMRGSYNRGAREGIWEFYDDNGMLQQKYDFTRHELLYFAVPPEARLHKHKVIQGTDTVLTELSRPPLFIGGDVLLREQFSTHFDYPKEAAKNGIEGTVLVSFIIDETGKAENYRIVKGIGYGCDEEAVFSLKKANNNWIPALLDNKPVSVEYIMPVKYRLND